MTDELYPRALLRLAADAAGAGRLPRPDVVGIAHNPTCGDRVSVELALAQGRIVIARHGGLLVPRAAVVSDEAGAHVFVIEGGKARQVAVTAGAEQGDDIEVAGPIKAGDAVAVEGAYQIEDGMAVRIARR